jgi:DNA-binding transcriptional ArsR family regulator
VVIVHAAKEDAMTVGPDAAPAMARFAAGFADPTRSAMCMALLDGRAWTAGELARHAGVARSTASEQLDLLVAAGILAEERQGRHRYLRLAGPEIAELIELLALHAPPHGEPRRTQPGSLRGVRTNAALRRARTCYDHLAGTLGVEVTDAMAERGLLTFRTGWAVTPAGLDWFGELGTDPDALRTGRRAVARGCLDWTERRPHLGGAAGAALCSRLHELGWIERPAAASRTTAVAGTARRIVRVTELGRAALRERLGLRWETTEAAAERP